MNAIERIVLEQERELVVALMHAFLKMQADINVAAFERAMHEKDLIKAMNAMNLHTSQQRLIDA
jgi:hypothetical protein